MPMNRSDYIKPDGRRLWLYGHSPLAPLDPAQIPSPGGSERVVPAAHMRWHPVVGEWVVYASHRQNRTFLPPADSNPLAPTIDPARPTELPAGEYDVAVFDNRFPSLSPDPGSPPELTNIPVAPASGQCEVVVFARDPATSLARLPVEHIDLILAVWADRTRGMTQSGIRYVLPFENRGVEMGVTLHHPHGQIYGYGFVPAQQMRAAANLRLHLEANGQDLITSLVASERADGTRVICDRPGAMSFVPPFARFPFETWVVPTRHVPDLSSLTDDERRDLAIVLKDALQRLDGLFGRPMPYLMTVNQAPTDGEAHPEWTLRIEIWPIRRAAEKLKYLAGTELGAGVFASDMSPEKAAADLQAVMVGEQS